MGTPSAKNLLLGAGKTFFDRFDENGNTTGLRHLGNVPTFNLTTTVTKVTKKSSMDAARTTYGEAITEITATAALTLDEFDPSNLAMALLGDEGVITQAASSVSDERHTAYIGRAIKLDAFKVSAVTIAPANPTPPAAIGAATPVGAVTSTGTVTTSGTYTGATSEDYYLVVTSEPTVSGDIDGCAFKWRKGLSGILSDEIDATGSAQEIELGVQVTLAVTGSQDFAVNDTWKISVTPALTQYSAGVDFKVDASLLRGGVILIPETSRIADGSPVLVSYTKAAGSFPKVAAATVGSVEGYMLFLGDPTKGPAYNADFWHVSITPDGDMGLIGDDFGSFNISVTVMDDRENHPDEPLHRLVKLN